METSDYLFFWKVTSEYGEFSQWFYSPFVVDKITFATMEQYMMYKKAKLFGDYETMNMIANTPALHPNEHKKMGRRVRNFDVGEWQRKSLYIVVIGNYHKFTQNQQLRSLLMSTGRSMLVQASPYDSIWGIGFDTQNALVNVNKWGYNRLGSALMIVRNAILNTKEMAR
ncbi:hypothetical protein LTS10_013230 [Elasticomyces elasticus]|nr:hypothetical protein LTS10_013230 [Elasticomyces elasticus]